MFSKLKNTIEGKMYNKTFLQSYAKTSYFIKANKDQNSK